MADTDVEVRISFDGRWVGGFDVVRIEDCDNGSPAVWLRRRSDGAMLPAPLPLADVRSRAGFDTLATRSA